MNKLAKFILAAATMALTLVGCQEPVEEPKTTISIETTVQATPQGGTYSLDYAIENPVAGATLTPSTPSVEWIYEVTVSEEKIEFQVDSNLSLGATSREGSFRLNYNSQELAEIRVSQSELSGTFSFEITKITPESITVDVVASNDQITWMCNFAPKAFVEQNGGIEKYVLIDANAYINSYYGDVLKDYLFTGSTTKTITMQYPPMDLMYIWVAGIVRDNDEAKTPILVTSPVVKEFTFIPYPTLSIEGESADRFSIEAGSHTIPYTLTNPIEGESISVKLLSGAENWVENVVVDTDAQTITFDYTANEFPIERLGILQIDYPYTESLLYEISQDANIQSENTTFEIVIKQMHYNSIVVDCTPSNNNVKYVVGAIAKCDFESYTYDSNPTNIPEMDLSASFRTFVVTKGVATDITLDNVAYLLDDEWYVYAYAVDNDEKIATSEVAMVAVTVPDDSPYFVWDDERVSSNALNTDKNGGTFTIKYSIENPLAGGVVKIEEPYDNILVKTDGKRVSHDAEAQTITFTVSANTDGYKRSTYIYLKYFSSADDTSSDANISLKISQSK